MEMDNLSLFEEIRGVKIFCYNKFELYKILEKARKTEAKFIEKEAEKHELKFKASTKSKIDTPDKICDILVNETAMDVLTEYYAIPAEKFDLIRQEYEDEKEKFGGVTQPYHQCYFVRGKKFDLGREAELFAYKEGNESTKGGN